MKKLKENLSTILLSAAFLFGLCLLLYPTVSNFYNSLHESHAIKAYTTSLENATGGLLREARDAARAYNEMLIGESYGRYLFTPEQEADYLSLLNLDGTGVMGYVEVPSINVRLTLSHTVDDSVLANGAGHIPGTSLPVGGEDTHAVLSGHRGLPSAKLFTDLDRLQVGDVFYVHTLNTTLAYEVDHIRIVEPGDLSELEIIPGKDLCTLLTCTPYGINTQRLLVRGQRIAYSRNLSVQAEATILSSLYLLPIMVTPSLLILLSVLLITTRKRGKKS